MCGIVGYIGKRDAYAILLEGLSILEYRGYDSAGLALASGGKLLVYKDKGKVDRLREITRDKPHGGSPGIAHTRWATHGAPSQVNAHPHTDSRGRIALVHNGIIENYQFLRDKLAKAGIRMRTETDTEVLAQLVGFHLNGDLAEAVRKALLEVEGTFGIAVISKDHPDVLIGARRGSPLVVGIDDNEFYLASDASAIVGHTKRVIYLNDNNMVELSRSGYRTSTLDNKDSVNKIQLLANSAAVLAKDGFRHFMLKEIYEQPETVLTAMRGRLLVEEGTARLDGLNLVLPELRRINRIIFVACGTSWHAALVGEHMIEEVAGIPVEVEYASEFRYRNPIIDDKTLVFVVSQSGETADTLAALREAAHKGATVLGICNAVGSSIARETQGGVYLHAGPEIGVASTKAFTSQLTILALLTLMLGRTRRISHDEGLQIATALQQIPAQMRKILKQNDAIKKVARTFAKSTTVLFLGRSYNFPVALEGALKMKEISYVHAEGYPAAEMKHGPIALIDKNTPSVFIALRDSVYEKVISNMHEIRARGGRILAIATEGDREVHNHADHVLYIPKTLPMLSPLLSVVPLQLLAYHVAAMRGCTIDQPRNLAKSVTVE